jgi:hypothetical protein
MQRNLLDLAEFSLAELDKLHVISSVSFQLHVLELLEQLYKPSELLIPRPQFGFTEGFKLLLYRGLRAEHLLLRFLELFVAFLSDTARLGCIGSGLRP